MKIVIITFITLMSLNVVSATDPIKPRSWYVEFDLSYPFHHYTHQHSFTKEGITGGLGLVLGKQRFPLFAEVYYQTPVRFGYRNYRLSEQFQELGLRYSLNDLSYIIPYGVDPYVGIGIIQRRSTFQKYEIEDVEFMTPVEQQELSKMNYKLTAGVKLGNNRFTLGIQYDYLPSRMNINRDEGEIQTFYNAFHQTSLRVGWRIYTKKRKNIKCPRFNNRVKRNLSF